MTSGPDGCKLAMTRRGLPCARRQFLSLGTAAFAACLISAPMFVGRAFGEAAQRINLDIKGGALPRERRTVRVTQGEQVELRFTSDRKLHLHLHGYDIERIVAPGATAVMAFHARIPGRFSITTVRDGKAKRGGHHHGGTVLYLEVHP